MLVKPSSNPLEFTLKQNFNQQNTNSSDLKQTKMSSTEDQIHKYLSP